VKRETTNQNFEQNSQYGWWVFVCCLYLQNNKKGMIFVVGYEYNNNNNNNNNKSNKINDFAQPVLLMKYGKQTNKQQKKRI
jgi:hypothetical protein